MIGLLRKQVGCAKGAGRFLSEVKKHYLFLFFNFSLSSV